MNQYPLRKRIARGALISAGAVLLVAGCSDASVRDRDDISDTELHSSAPEDNSTITGLAADEFPTAADYYTPSCEELADDTQPGSSTERLSTVDSYTALRAPDSAYPELRYALGSYSVADIAEQCQQPDVAQAYRTDAELLTGFTEADTELAIGYLGAN